jgi:hypothetical protein
MKTFKEYMLESKIPEWDIKTKSWKNASKSYIENQKDIVDDLKKITLKNINSAIEKYRLENRDFNIVNGSDILKRIDEKVQEEIFIKGERVPKLDRWGVKSKEVIEGFFNGDYNPKKGAHISFSKNPRGGGIFLETSEINKFRFSHFYTDNLNITVEDASVIINNKNYKMLSRKEISELESSIEVNDDLSIDIGVTYKIVGNFQFSVSKGKTTFIECSSYREYTVYDDYPSLRDLYLDDDKKREKLEKSGKLISRYFREAKKLLDGNLKGITDNEYFIVGDLVDIKVGEWEVISVL